jgi:endoglucanase
MHFGNLLLLTSTVALALAAPSAKQKRKNFTWFGVNESGAEFGSGNIPGTLGTDYTWPVT